MIKPHGSDKLNPLYVVDDAKRKPADQGGREPGLPIVVSSAAAGNAVMLGSGYFNPLTGFMDKADSLSVAANLKTTKGLFWPVPIVNMVKDAKAIHGAKRIDTPVLLPGEHTVVGEVRSAQDQRSSNDRAYVVVRSRNSVGVLVINELMYEPFDGSCEWVELYNRSSEDVDLRGWELSDAPTPAEECPSRASQRAGLPRETRRLCCHRR